MTQAELQEIKGAVREHTGLIYRADLNALLKAGEENASLTAENATLQKQLEDQEEIVSDIRHHADRLREAPSADDADDAKHWLDEALKRFDETLPPFALAVSQGSTEP